MNRNTLTQPDLFDENARLADFIRKLGDAIAEREAKNPSPPGPPPEPWADKPGSLIAAEKDLCRWEMCQKFQRWLCRDLAKCEDVRCRRSKRCRELENIATQMEASRIRLAAERAQWHPPVSQADPPRGRKKGRTAVRP